jgi:hypothetical protein
MATERVEEEEKFDTSRGTPKFHLKEHGKILRIKCEMTGRATKDNGFIGGTSFIGRVSEKNGKTHVFGLITTSPIYHLAFIALLIAAICIGISIGGFPLTPIILIPFDILMFKDEFKKQPLIKRYIFRSLKITYRETNK